MSMRFRKLSWGIVTCRILIYTGLSFTVFRKMTTVIVSCLLVLLTLSFADLLDQPKIFTKGGNLHITSGNHGNIVFEPSQQGKVLLGSHELNATGSIGSPGEKGDKGERGVRGNPGPKGNLGLKGDQGKKGESGTSGENGQKGEPGREGQKGDIGSPGTNGTAGTPGPPGAQGPPGPRGPEVNIGPATYYTDLDRYNEKCNSSSVGILRYSLKGLQLCTTVGWRNIALESDPPRCSEINIPEKNLQAFYKGNPGVMFQFNNDIIPLINPPHLNSSIKAELVSQTNNSNVSYVDAVMRQAIHFSGNHYVTVSGISENFWRNSNWSVTALLKFGGVTRNSPVYNDVRVLGIGSGSKSDVLHLGIRGSEYNGHIYYRVLFEHKDNNFQFDTVSVDTWYYITWTSEKTSGNQETRCIIIDGTLHKCDLKRESYEGRGDIIIGAWQDGQNSNSLTLDHLIISSGVISYEVTKKERQLCNAKLADKRLP